jgi:hypothetical protein
MSKKKLIGEIMVQMGIVTRDVVTECLNMQTEIHQKNLDPMPLGRLLMKTGHITQDQLEKALTKQQRYHLPN